MRDRDLAQAERLIAECKTRIARQREVIAHAFREGHDTKVAVSLLRAFEASLREAPSAHPRSAKRSGAAMTGKNRI
jgi:hypothetical protein